MQKNKNIVEQFEKNLEMISLRVLDEESYLDRWGKKIEDALTPENIFAAGVSAFKKAKRKLLPNDLEKISDDAVKKIEKMRKDYEELKTEYYNNRFKKNIGKNSPEYKSKVLSVANRMKELETKIAELKEYVLDEEKPKVAKKEVTPVSTDMKKEDKQTQIRHAVDMLNVAKERYKRLKSPANKQELIRARMNLNRLTGTVGSPGSLTDSFEMFDEFGLLEEGLWNSMMEKINPSELTKFKNQFYVPLSKEVKKLFNYYKSEKNLYIQKDVNLLMDVYTNLTAKGEISLHNTNNGTIFIEAQQTYFKFLTILHMYTIVGSVLFQKFPKLYNYLNQIKTIKNNYDESDLEKKANIIKQMSVDLKNIFRKIKNFKTVEQKRIADIKTQSDMNFKEYFILINSANSNLLNLIKKYRVEIDQDTEPTKNSSGEKKKGNKKVKKRAIADIEKALKSGKPLDANTVYAILKNVAKKYPQALQETTASIRLRRNPRTGLNKLVLVCKSGEYKKPLNRTINIGGKQVKDVMCLPKSSKPAMQKEKDRKSAVKRWKKIHANPMVMKQMIRKRMETKSQSRTIR